MRTHPITAAFVAAGMLAGCGQPAGTVKKAEYEALEREYADLKASVEITRQEYVEQAMAMDDILQELSQVSGHTAALRTNVEQGTARLTQVEVIEGSINEIKRKLDQLDHLTKDNARYRKLVSSLRQVISGKEQEIERLRSDIEARDRTISEQNQTITEQTGTIQSQHETIETQQENLRRSVQEQAKMLYQAGRDFEELGDASPSVSRRKDKAKVKVLTREMYEKAIFYYSKAQETGYPEAAYQITEIQEKISLLGDIK